MEQGVGDGEQPQHHHQGAEVVQLLRQPEMTQHQPPAPATQCPHAEPEAHRLGEQQQGMRGRIAGHAERDVLIDQHRQQRADRVDHDAFPAQDLGQVAARAQRLQQWHHHRRTCHHQQGAEHGGHLPAHVEQIVGGHGADHAGDHHAGGDQSPDDMAMAAQVLEVQRQAALEQDDRHRQRDQREQEIAEQLIRLQPTRDGAGEDADDQQRQDGGQTHAPGQPLAAEGHQTDQGQGQSRFGHRVSSLESAKMSGATVAVTAHRFVVSQPSVSGPCPCLSAQA